jgi:hypothetical protein
VRLRHPAQPHRTVPLPISNKGAKPLAWVRSERLAGFGNNVLAQRSSIFSTEHALLREWSRDRAGQRSAVRERRTRRATLRASCTCGRYAARYGPVAQSRCVCLRSRSEYRSLLRRQPLLHSVSGWSTYRCDHTRPTLHAFVIGHRAMRIADSDSVKVPSVASILRRRSPRD